MLSYVRETGSWTGPMHKISLYGVFEIKGRYFIIIQNNVSHTLCVWILYSVIFDKDKLLNTQMLIFFKAPFLSSFPLLSLKV